MQWCVISFIQYCLFLRIVDVVSSRIHVYFLILHSILLSASFLGQIAMHDIHVSEIESERLITRFVCVCLCACTSVYPMVYVLYFLQMIFIFVILRVMLNNYYHKPALEK